MKMNKKIVIGLAIIAAFMMIAVPLSITGLTQETSATPQNPESGECISVLGPAVGPVDFNGILYEFTDNPTKSATNETLGNKFLITVSLDEGVYTYTVTGTFGKIANLASDSDAKAVWTGGGFDPSDTYCFILAANDVDFVLTKVNEAPGATTVAYDGIFLSGSAAPLDKTYYIWQKVSDSYVKKAEVVMNNVTLTTDTSFTDGSMVYKLGTGVTEAEFDTIGLPVKMKQGTDVTYWSYMSDAVKSINWSDGESTAAAASADDKKIKLTLLDDLDEVAGLQTSGAISGSGPFNKYHYFDINLNGKTLKFVDPSGIIGTSSLNKLIDFRESEIADIYGGTITTDEIEVNGLANKTVGFILIRTYSPLTLGKDDAKLTIDISKVTMKEKTGTDTSGNIGVAVDYQGGNNTLGSNVTINAGSNVAVYAIYGANNGRVSNDYYPQSINGGTDITGQPTIAVKVTIDGATITGEVGAACYNPGNGADFYALGSNVVLKSGTINGKITSGVVLKNSGSGPVIGDGGVFCKVDVIGTISVSNVQVNDIGVLDVESTGSLTVTEKLVNTGKVIVTGTMTNNGTITINGGGAKAQEQLFIIDGTSASLTSASTGNIDGTCQPLIVLKRGTVEKQSIDATNVVDPSYYAVWIYSVTADACNFTGNTLKLKTGTGERGIGVFISENLGNSSVRTVNVTGNTISAAAATTNKALIYVNMYTTDTLNVTVNTLTLNNLTSVDGQAVLQIESVGSIGKYTTADSPIVLNGSEFTSLSVVKSAPSSGNYLAIDDSIKSLRQSSRQESANAPVLSGTFSFESIVVSNESTTTLIVGASSEVTLTGTSSIKGLLINKGTVNINGTFNVITAGNASTMDDGKYIVSATGTLTIEDTKWIASDGKLKLASGATAIVTTNSNNGFNCVVTGNSEIPAGQTFVVYTNDVVSTTGTMTVNGTLSIATVGSVSTSGNGKYVATSSGVVSIAGTEWIGANGTVVLSNGSNAVIVSNTASGFTATLNGIATIPQDETLVLATNDMLVANGQVDVRGALTIAKKEAASTSGNGKYVASSSATVTIAGTKWIASDGIVQLSNAATATLSTNALGGFDCVLDGTAAIVSGKTLVIGEKDALTVNGKLTNAGTINNTGVINVDGTLTTTGTFATVGSINVGSSGKIDGAGTISFGAAASSTKVINVANGGVLTVTLDGTDTAAGAKESKVVLTAIAAGEGGITVTKGSVIIDGVIATPDAEGKIAVPAGSTVYVSGTVDEGVTLEIPATSVVVVPQGATLEVAAGAKVTNNGEIDVKSAGSEVIYEKGSVVNGVVIEVTTKEDNSGVHTVVIIWLVSEDPTKLAISENYVEAFSGAKYSEVLSLISVTPLRNYVTFTGWYNMAMNEKITLNDTVLPYEHYITACFDAEKRVPVPDEDVTPVIPDNTSGSSNVNEFALPIAFILLVCAIFALGFVIIRKK